MDGGAGVEAESDGLGCLKFVLTMIVLWALLFGVTWKGRHHGVSCTCDRGVVVTP